MSDNDNESRETVADIVADIRERAENAMRNGERLVHNEAVANMLTFVADRIEAAAKRGDAQPGNAAAMREALEELMKFTCNSCERRLCEDDAEEEDGQRAPILCSAIIRARAALSAPARNCDVGTAEEQTRRMNAQICSKQISCYELPSGEHCPLYRTGVDCRMAWAQTPYEAEEGGAK